MRSDLRIGLFICAAVCAVSLAAMAMLVRSGPEFTPLAVAAAPAPSSEFYLAYFRGGIENYMLYNNVDHVIEPVKRAGVLFLGNSRMLYAMRDQKVLDRCSAMLGMKCYVLAFGYYEGEQFPEEIIRRYDLHPKWVVVNADPFFGVAPSATASKVMSGSYFDALKFRFEMGMSFEIQRRLHRNLAYLGLSQWSEQPDWIYYRSRNDGTIRLAAYRGNPSSAQRTSGGLGGQQARERIGTEIEAARRFRDELLRRGGNLILTSVPPSPDLPVKAMASALNVPLVDGDLPGLSTFDGSHLDPESATRFSSSLLRQIAGIMGAGSGSPTKYVTATFR